MRPASSFLFIQLSNARIRDILHISANLLIQRRISLHDFQFANGAAQKIGVFEKRTLKLYAIFYKMKEENSCIKL